MVYPGSIRLFNGGKAMDNGYNRFTLSKCWKCLLNQMFISGSMLAVASSKITIGAFFRIARAIEILCFSPPEREDPPSPYHGVISFGISWNKLMTAGCFCGSNNFIFRSIRFAKTDVIRKILHKTVTGEFPDIMSAHGNCSTIHMAVTWNQAYAIR